MDAPAATTFGHVLIAAGAVSTVAHVPLQRHQNSRDPRADARLIAAAPDMLAALVAAYAAIDAINPHDEAVGALNRAGLATDLVMAQRAIFAAIAKAEGRDHA